MFDLSVAMFRFLVYIPRSIPSSLVYYKYTYALVNSEMFPLSNNNNNNNNINNNNNNKGSRGMGEVAPLYGVDSALVLTNPGVQ